MNRWKKAVGWFIHKNLKQWRKMLCIAYVWIFPICGTVIPNFKCIKYLPGRRLREIFWGMIWMTSYWLKPDPLELSGMFCRTEVLLVGYSIKCSSQPLFCKFWIKSHLDVRVFPLPKSCIMEKPQVIICCDRVKTWNILTFDSGCP